MSLLVRGAVPADGAGLGALLAELGYPDADQTVAERLDRMTRDARALVLVAVEGTEIVGAAVLAFVPVLHDGGEWCRITAMVVDPRHRSKGVGRMLVGAAEEAAGKRGCSRIEATSAVSRVDAHRFYAEIGFARTSDHFLKRI